jgi:hypothetical protein
MNQSLGPRGPFIAFSVLRRTLPLIRNCSKRLSPWVAEQKLLWVHHGVGRVAVCR